MEFMPDIPGWSSGLVHQWAHSHGHHNSYHSTSEEKASSFSLTTSAEVVLRGSSGYTKNHLSYQMTHQTLAIDAYALHGGHVVIVKVQAIHMLVGKTKAQLIGVSQTFENVDLMGLTQIPWFKDVLQAVNNVPVHIGAVELKGLLYEHILPVWNAYTEGFLLEINDFIMRMKEWVEIKPLNPDQDVIACQFFKSGNGGLTFKAGHCIILHIPNAIYNKYIYNAEKEMERLQQG